MSIDQVHAFLGSGIGVLLELPVADFGQYRVELLLPNFALQVVQDSDLVE
jgi:hypothetical protein